MHSPNEDLWSELDVTAGDHDGRGDVVPVPARSWLVNSSVNLAWSFLYAMAQPSEGVANCTYSKADGDRAWPWALGLGAAARAKRSVRRAEAEAARKRAKMALIPL